jgi:hypothetical protein
MPGASPTQLTLRYLRELGFLAQVVERWLPTQEPGVKEQREARLAAAAALEPLEYAILVPLREELDRRGLNLAQIGVCVEMVRKPLFDAGRRLLADLPREPQSSPGRRIDLLGLIDVLCLDGKPGCLGVQCCACSGISAHLKEMREGKVKMPRVGTGATFETSAHYELKRYLAGRWLFAGNRLSILGWHKVDGKWTPRVVEITAELLGG